METGWNDLNMDMNVDLGDGGLQDSSYDFSGLGNGGSSIPNDGLFSQELLALGLEEPLPPQDMIDEL